jgi:hypothetical protein
MRTCLRGEIFIDINYYHLTIFLSAFETLVDIVDVVDHIAFYICPS